MRRIAIVFAAGMAAALASPAQSQASRTWVSGVGDDVNPCSRTAPCKTFAAAIQKTASGGQISCLDPGGFGSVTIATPITIICDYTEGGVLVQGTNGMVVNLAGPGSVLLSGLHITSTSGSGSGVRIIGAGTVHIRNSVIRSFSQGAGISVEPRASVAVVVTHSTISGNQTGIAAAGSGRVIVSGTDITANAVGVTTTGAARILSMGTNVLQANVSDGRFSGTQPQN